MTKIYKILIGLLCVVSFPSFAAAQHQIKGVVVDEKGDALPGVTVVVTDQKGVGVSTDAKGAFSISVPTNVKKLSFSFIGMQTKEVAITPSTNFLNVKMEVSVGEMDQIVVTGYAQTTKKMITGSVGVIKAEVFENKPQTSVDALMQGQLAGVSVSAVTGQPGRSQKIRIRGTSSILSGAGEPLWVVDGVPLQKDMVEVSASQIKTSGFDDVFVNGIGNINPNDIESITVLKDASAAAIYGSQAANGVIVVTTKRGKVGDMKVNYSANVSVTMSPQNDPSLMNSAEKLAWENELWNEFSADKYLMSQTDASVIYPTVGIVGMIRSGAGVFSGMKGNVAAQDAYISELAGRNTDWYDMIFRDSFSTNHHLSISGGTERYNYYVSAGYTYNNGLLIKDNYNRYNLNSNFSFTPNKNLKIDLGYDVAQQETKSPNLTYVDPFKYAYFANPYEQAYNEDGSYRADETYYNLGVLNGDTDAVMSKNGFNMMREINETSSKTSNWANTLRAGINLKLAKTVSLVGLASYSFANTKSDGILGENTEAAFYDRLGTDKYNNKSYYGSISQSSSNRTSYITRAHVSYIESFNRIHDVSIIAGAELRGSSSKNLFAKRYNYDPNTGGTSLPPVSGNIDNWLAEVEKLSGEQYGKSRYASFYASGDYSLLSRYIFNFSFRTDGSSYFGSERQFNPTWSAGLAWHIAEEGFMQPLEKVVNRLSLRMAAGFTGNVSGGVSPQLVMSYWEQEYRKYGDSSFPLGSFSGAPNPRLQWEKTRDMKIALDFGLFNDRLSGVVEGYNRNSSGVVTSSRISSYIGYQYLAFNSAEISNSGIEVTLNGAIVDNKNFKLNASVNFAYNTNKVTKYTPSSGKLTIGDRYWEGYPVGSIFGGKIAGIDSETGLTEFILRPDAVINNAKDLNSPDNYRFYLGTTIAPYTGGFNVRASYRSISLSIGGVYSTGSKSYDKINSPADYTDVDRQGYSVDPIQLHYNDLYANHLNVRKNRTDRWKEGNTTGTEYPRIYDAFGGNGYGFDYYNPMALDIVNSIYLKNTSYVRIKNIVIGYDLPSKLLKRVKLSNVGLNLSLNNFFTFTDYDGFDPETPGATYPISRSVTFGINIGF